MANILKFPRMEAGPDFESSNEEKALELIDIAMETGSTVQKKRFARKALELDPNCVEAYSMLAEEYESKEKKREFYEKGMDAFVQKYGASYFEENKGYFWGLLKTRPYMQLCEGYGQFLWEIGEQSSAIKMYEDLLELNPMDNLGLRYILINWLLNTDALDKVEAILKKYMESSAFMLFSDLLLKMKKNPKNDKSIRVAYKKAVESNPYVIGYLLLECPLPVSPPPFYSPGEDDEAITYCVYSMESWIEQDKAILRLQDLFYEQ